MTTRVCVCVSAGKTTPPRHACYAEPDHRLSSVLHLFFFFKYALVDASQNGGQPKLLVTV